MPEPLTILSMGHHTRLGDILEFALGDCPFTTLTAQALPNASLSGKRVLFALSIDASGVEEDYYQTLGFLRTHPGALDGCIGGILVDGETALYTKALARELAFTANMAGCAFPGKSLVEATKLLQNFDVLCGVHGVDRYTAYKNAAKSLVERVADFFPSRHPRPHILMLHASNRDSSNTLALGLAVQKRLEATCDVTELSLQDKAIYDCNGCGFRACVHFAEKGKCFYGGVLPESVFPAMEEANALLLLCPNYNDAPGAHFLAMNNRLNALLLRGKPLDKAIFSIIVSGYSGGDVVAQQLLGGLSLNKPFCLPARFALLETANDPGSVMQQTGIQARIDAFAANISAQLVSN